ncbi:MAG TPA: T9SS type A sorting domain-containing protein [Flavipsychrobacter sp.]|nr:T9SS type A sorting domain-containing protein [Flavipsychrobacter sp.]
MKRIFTTLFSLSVLSASAQITLNQQSFSATYVGIDSMKLLMAGQTYPTIAPTTNGNWDFSSLNYTNAFSTITRSAFSNSAFPGGTQATHMYYAFSGSLGYDFGMVDGISAANYSLQGERILRQAIPLGSLTGGTTDSLLFPEQNVIYSSPRKVLSFPATNGSTWGGSYNFTTDLNLTVVLYGLNSAPGQRKTYLSYRDTVIGWGKVKVKDFSGNASGSMNVLMVKHMEKQVDSFFLNGAPAPPQLLSAFSLTQGLATEVNEVSFYRAGEITPLVRVSYFDTTFTQAQISEIEVHTNRLANPASISDVTKYGKIALYPNPLTGNQLTISLDDKAVRTLQYDVMNINGQIIAKGNVSMNSGKGYVGMNEAKSTGIYYVRLYSDGQLLTTLPLSIQ